MFKIQSKIISQMKKQENVTHIKEKENWWRLTLSSYYNFAQEHKVK